MKKIILSISVLLTTVGFSQSLDPSFNSSGAVPGLIRTVGAGGGQGGEDVAINSSGEIFTCSEYYTGTIESFNWHFALSKYNIDGELDNTFGTGGTVVTDFSNDGQDRSMPNKILLQPDGKIIVAGHKLVVNDLYTTLVMARYDVSGNLDPTFGNGGKVISATNTLQFAYYMSAVLQSDGKIILVGTNNTGGDDDLAVLRYNSDGTIDNTFGVNGMAQFDLPLTMESGTDVQLTSENKIVISGIKIENDDSSPFWTSFVAQLNSDGTIDNTFGTNGFTHYNIGGSLFHEIVSSIGIQSTGKIVAFGTAITPTSDYLQQYTIRFDENGTIDNTYGNEGISLVNYENQLFEMITCTKLIVLPDDGLFLLGGTDSIACSLCQHNQNLSVVKLKPDGEIDYEWGNFGKFNMNIDFQQVTPFPIASREHLQSGVMQPDGKLLCIGQYESSSETLLLRIDTLSSEGQSSGLSILENENGFSVYPNPAVNNLTIVCDKLPGEKIYYTILNTIGQVIKTNEIHATENVVDISNLGKGIYFVELFSSSNPAIYSEKIIVTK